MALVNVLNEAMKSKFLQNLQSKGIDTSNIPEHVLTNETRNYLTDQPGVKSAVPAKMLAVHSLDELKALAGNSDDDYVSGNMATHLHEDLPAWDSARSHLAQSELTAEENNNIANAFKTYIYGHSAKVSSYKDVITNHYFPMKLAVYAAQNLTVKAGQTYIVDGSNAIAEWGTVTVEKGGVIQYQVNSTWTVQSWVSE